MNIPAIRYIREVIANGEDDKFDMATLGNGCGTPACIAGWTVAAFGGRTDGDILNQARDFLDLTPREAADLFLGEYGTYELGEITKNDALEFLDRVISTNQVDPSYWNLPS
jgi:hypothetical protein